MENVISVKFDESLAAAKAKKLFVMLAVKGSTTQCDLSE